MTPYWHDFKIVQLTEESQIAIEWDEEFCARCNTIAKEDHSCVATAEERKRRENSWVLALNSQGKKTVP